MSSGAASAPLKLAGRTAVVVLSGEIAVPWELIGSVLFDVTAAVGCGGPCLAGTDEQPDSAHVSAHTQANRQSSINPSSLAC